MKVIASCVRNVYSLQSERCGSFDSIFGYKYAEFYHEYVLYFKFNIH